MVEHGRALVTAGAAQKGYVPGNRWDLLAGIQPAELPTVTVVVVHYRQQAELDRTLACLARQDYPAELVEIIVVDDGSPQPPRVSVGVQLICQEDRGFRAGAARNLGAQTASGTVLCFLDADTSPEPGYLRELSRLPALAEDAVTVGRRWHADLRELPVSEPIEEAGPAHRLPDPGWLRDGYDQTGNLLRADDRSYRFVISAVLCCRRSFFFEVGGFDESFDDYGGEDWEWAYRAWLDGAVLAFVPAAVAWHDGPDWSGRQSADPTTRRRKDAESLRLAELIPAPGSRGSGLRYRYPDMTVILEHSSSASAAVICVDSVLVGISDAMVVVPDAVIGAFPGDGRVVAASAVDPTRSARSRFTVRIPEPVRFEPASLPNMLSELTSRGLHRLVANDDDHAALVEVTSRRASARAQRWPDREPFPSAAQQFVGVQRIGEDFGVAAYFGGW